MLRILMFVALAGMARADGERAGAFDYYVLALSWTPSYCTLDGDAKGDDRCDKGEGIGFSLHGLWPQFEQGWPSYCRSSVRNPSRSDSARQADLFGSGGAAWYQWKKHGRCAGLSAAGYFDLAREAFASVRRPEIFRKLPEQVSLPPKVVEEAFLEANPTLLPSGVTITCQSGFVQEVRICLTKDLDPRICGRDVQRDCPSSSVKMAPIR